MDLRSPTSLPKNLARDLPKGLIQIHKHEFWEILSQYGFKDFNAMKDLLYSEPDVEKNSPFDALLKIGKAKAHSLEGNLLAAKQFLDESRIILLSMNTTNEVERKLISEFSAYGCYENAVLLTKSGDVNQSNKQLLQAKQLTTSPNLLIQVDFGMIANMQRQQKLHDISPLEKYADRFARYNMTISRLFALREIANYKRKNKEVDESISLFKHIIQTAHRWNLQYIEDLTANSLAYATLVSGDLKDCESLSRNIINRTHSKYILAVAYENLAICLAKQDRIDEAVEIVETSLEMCIKHNVISRIAAHTDYLSEVYENHFKDLKMASHYLQLGYDQSLLHLQYGMNLDKFRLKVIKRYVQFLYDHAPSTITDDSYDPFFDFTLGHSWQEIKDLFHYNLIVYHQIHSGKTGKILKALDMPPTTFYSLRNRLESRGIQFMRSESGEEQLPSDQFIEPLQRYIQMHAEKNWIEINRQFEGDAFKFLYHHYGYSKQRLAKILDLSYSVIIEKTRSLTELPDTPPLLKD